MNFFEGNFIYNNIESSYFNVVIAQLESTAPNFIGGNLKYNTIKFRSRMSNSISSFSSEDFESFEIEILSPNIITFDKAREIYNAYFNHLDYKKFYTSQVGYENIFCNLIFKNPTKIERYGQDGYGVYGFKCLVELDGQFAWRDEKKIEFSQSQLNNNIRVYYDSDIRDYYYPKVQINLNSFTGLGKRKIIIQCITDNNRQCIIEDVVSADRIIMSTCPKIIKSDINDKLNYLETFNKKWVRFLPQNNIFSIGLYNESGERIQNGIIKSTFTFSEGLVI